jgi:YjbE family integral membrane protein
MQEGMMEIATALSWWGLGAVIWTNIILSADNVVVMALAARSLPPQQKKLALFLGAGAAILLRIALTIIALELLKLPLLKIIGGLALLWIAVKLLLPGGGNADIQGASNLIQAVKTIVVADLVMSVDNVIAVAAAAQGSVPLLVLGLAISMPLVILGATLLLRLMERYPVIIVLGAAILGWVAGGMLVTDPVVAEWIDANLHWMRIRSLGISWAEIAGALLVVGVGRWLATRTARA